MDKCHHSVKQSRHRSPRARLLIGRINLFLLKLTEELRRCFQDKRIIQDSKKLENDFTSFYSKLSLKYKCVNKWNVQVGWWNTRLGMLRLLVYAKSKLVSCFGGWKQWFWYIFFPVVAYMMEPINNEISNLTRMKNLFLSCKEKFHWWGIESTLVSGHENKYLESS